MLKVVCNSKNCPKPLQSGKNYRVKKAKTTYELDGIEGSFNSIFFDTRFINCSLAISNTLPTKGQRFKCKKVVLKNNSVVLEDVRTTTVEEITSIGRNTYEVVTSNSKIIVQVYMQM